MINHMYVLGAGNQTQDLIYIFYSDVKACVILLLFSKVVDLKW